MRWLTHFPLYKPILGTTSIAHTYKTQPMNLRLINMAVRNNRKSLCSDAIMMTIQISCTEMIYHFSGVPSPSIPHTEQGCWGRSSADLLWKLSPHLGRVDSDGLAPAQRRPALWVSSLLQEKQGADALKCGGFQSLSDSFSRWVMTCEIHRQRWHSPVVFQRALYVNGCKFWHFLWPGYNLLSHFYILKY